MKNSLGRVLEASFIRTFAGLMVLMCLIFAYKYDAKAAGTAGIIEQKKEGKITWTLTSDGELTVSGKGELDGTKCSYSA